MKTFNTREEILQDAINYYWGNNERRCYHQGACRYTPTETSEGCAIGRLVDQITARKLAEKNHTIHNSNDTFDMLPTWLKNMGREFLETLQFSHDMEWFTRKSVVTITDKMTPLVDMTKITFPEA